MRTRSIGFAAIVALAAIAFTVTSLTAKQQTATKWDYLRVAPGFGAKLIDTSQHGYQACQATDSEWQCREFRATNPEIGSDEPLRRALATLGGEGWELVAAVDQSPGVAYPSGMTYLLKRPRQ